MSAGGTMECDESGPSALFPIYLPWIDPNGRIANHVQGGRQHVSWARLKLLYVGGSGHKC